MPDPMREHLIQLLSWRKAHADFEAAVAGLPPELRGVAPAGLPYSPWQLLEHLRLSQADILSFCTRVDYEEGDWPDDYWPATAAPPDAQAWDASVAAFRRDLHQLQALARDENVDLLAGVPSGTGATLLRELLLIADHTAYHLGQLVTVRRLLGAWNPDRS